MNLKFKKWDLVKRFNCHMITRHERDNFTEIIWDFDIDNDEIMHEAIEGSIEFTEMIVRSGYEVINSWLQVSENVLGRTEHSIFMVVNIPYAEIEGGGNLYLN